MAITHVNSYAERLGQSGGTTAAYDTTGATLLAVTVNRWGSGTPNTFSDSEGNSWTLARFQANTNEIEIWYCINPIVSATHTFTETGTNVYSTIIISGYTADTWFYDQSTGGHRNFNNYVYAGSITPAEDNTLLLTVVGSQPTAGVAHIIDSGYTIRAGYAGTAGGEYTTDVADKIIAVSAANNPKWTRTPAVNYRTAVHVAFYEVPILPTSIPLIIDTGVIQQSPGKLTDVVYSDSDLTPDNALVRVDGTDKDVQTSTALLADTGALTLNQNASLETSGAHEFSFFILDSTGDTSFAIHASTALEGNLGLGPDTLQDITTGRFNFCFGDTSGFSLTEGSSNIAVGNGALYDLTTGNYNIALGANAGGDFSTTDANISIGVNTNRLNAAGANNVAIGYFARRYGTTGDNNVSIGSYSLYVSAGNSNVAIGYSAGRSLTTGGTCTFIGPNAGYSGSQLVSATNSTALGNGAYTTASNQVVIGNSSVTETVLQAEVKVEQKAASETSGAHTSAFTLVDSTGTTSIEFSAQTAASENFGFGLECLASITTGAFNVCLGTYAGTNIADGNSNVCIGSAAGVQISSGDYNFCLGVSAASLLSTGNRNILVGQNSGDGLTSGSDNIAMGGNSLLQSNGDGNVALGRYAGRSLTPTGYYNTFIGYSAGYNVSQDTGSNWSTAIGFGAYTTKDHQVVIGDSSVTETILRGDVFTGDGAYETLKRVAKTADYVIADNETLILVDASTNDVTITLPAAADLVDTPVHIKLVDVGSGYALTIEANGAETIDGELNVVTGTKHTCVVIVSDGTEWRTIQHLYAGPLTGTTTFGYNGSNQLTTIATSGGTKTLTYSGTLLATISDTESNTLSTFNYTGTRLDSKTVTQL